MFVTAQDFETPPFVLTDLEHNDSFSDFVAEREEYWLSKILGRLFFDALKLGIESLPESYDDTADYDTNEEVTYNGKVWKSLVDNNPDDPSTPNWEEVATKTRWLVLRDGASYRYNQRKLRFVGFNKACRALVHSLWLADLATKISGSGVVSPKSENSEGYPVADRVVASWNEFVDNVVGEFREEFCEDEPNERNSLYGYLLSTPTTYDDVVDDEDYEDFENYVRLEIEHPGWQNAVGI